MNKEKLPLSVWTIIFAILGVVVVVASRQPKVAEWVIAKAPALAFILPPVADPTAANTPALTGVVGLIGTPFGALKAGPKPVRPPAALPAPPPVSTTVYDECSAWGRDTAAYVNCEDHKEKVQTYIQSAQERNAISEEALAKEAGGKDVKSKEAISEPAPKKKKSDK